MSEKAAIRVERCDMVIVCEPDAQGHREIKHVDGWWRSPRLKTAAFGPGSPTDALYRRGLGW